MRRLTEEERLKRRRAQQKSYYERVGRAKKIAAVKEYRARDPEKWAAYSAKWKRANPDRVREHWGQRMAQMTQPPLWANRRAITDVYALAALMTTLLGSPYEVDHVIPLRGRIACGLHVPENLQVITKRDNARKGNKMPPS